MKKMTSTIAITPAIRLWCRKRSPSVGADLLARQLLDRERQLAELQDRDEVLRLRPREAADAAGLDLDLAAGDRALIRGAEMTLPSRTIAKNSPTWSRV